MNREVHLRQCTKRNVDSGFGRAELFIFDEETGLPLKVSGIYMLSPLRLKDVVMLRDLMLRLPLDTRQILFVSLMYKLPDFLLTRSIVIIMIDYDQELALVATYTRKR